MDLMGQRGPPKKPTAVRRREGNPGKRRLPNDEPQPTAVDKLPEPPAHLDKRAAAVFRNLAKILKDSDLLTVADVYPLEIFCDKYSQWVQAIDARREKGVMIEVSREGPDGELHIMARYESPESKLVRNLAADCNRWFKVLGLGPAYRVGLRTTADGNEEIEDPLAASIANG